MVSLDITVPLSEWRVESSHLAAVPKSYKADGLVDLRRQIQDTADKAIRVDRPPMGPISFRFETNDDMRVIRVHCYFINKHGKLARFMRLCRES